MDVVMVSVKLLWFLTAQEIKHRVFSQACHRCTWRFCEGQITSLCFWFSICQSGLKKYSR